MRRRTRMTLLTPLRHPLAMCVLLYIPVVAFGWFESARATVARPVALVLSDADGESFQKLDNEESRALIVSALQEANASLQAENATLRAAAAQLADLRSYDRAIFDEAVPARIVMRGGASQLKHTLVVNRGSSHGVSVGDAVAIGRVYLGEVVGVEPECAVVRMLSDPAARVSVSIVKSGEPALPRERSPDEVLPDDELFAARKLSNRFLAQAVARGVAQGDGSDALRLPSLNVGQVAVDREIEVGMVVVTNGFNGSAPPGLIVGHVSNVEDRSVQLSIEVEAPYDTRLVSVVSLLPNKRPSIKALTAIVSGDADLKLLDEDARNAFIGAESKD